jgi:hypothetical protein
MFQRIEVFGLPYDESNKRQRNGGISYVLTSLQGDVNRMLEFSIHPYSFFGIDLYSRYKLHF